MEISTDIFPEITQNYSIGSPPLAQLMFSNGRGLMFLSSVVKGKVGLELIVSLSLRAFSVYHQLYACNFYYLCFMLYTVVKTE